MAADRVFVAETKDQKTEIVRALDRATGRELWKAEWPGAMSVPFMAKRNGDWIRSTPAYDGHSLFVAGMRDVLVCLDAKTGKERWRVDFVKQFKAPLPDFGFVCSPLVVGDFVYVQAGAGFCKLDKQTGKVLWRVLTDGGGMFGSAFSSPIYTTLGGKPQLVVQTRLKLAGVEPDSGKVLWSQDIPAMLGMNIVTPTVLGDRIYTSSYGGGSRLLEIKRTGDEFQAQTVWKTPLQGYMSTPVIIDGHAYLHLRNQRFTCVDLATGKQTVDDERSGSANTGAWWPRRTISWPGPARRIAADSCHTREVRSSRLKEDQRRGDVGAFGRLRRPGVHPRTEWDLGLPLAIIGIGRRPRSASSGCGFRRRHRYDWRNGGDCQDRRP